MVVAAHTPINSYLGNDSASSFPFTFPVFNSAQVQVEVEEISTSNVTPLNLGVDYTVAGLNPSGSPATTGTVNLVNSGQAWLTAGKLATGFSLIIQSNFPLSQTTSIRNQGDYDRGALEDALDNLEYQIQQLHMLVSSGGGGGGGGGAGGLILADLSNGHTYQVASNNGVIGLILIS